MKFIDYGRSFAAALALTAASAPALADIELPSRLTFTAYDVGSSGYSQVVGIGSVMKNEYGTSVRVLPGKNDVSRLGPVVQGRAEFTATGSDSVYAQEGVFTFGTREWGPQPLRIAMLAIGKGAAVAMVTPGDRSIETLADVKGRRVAYVRGAPALNKAVESHLACAGLTWDDVEIVEFGGHGPTVDGFINDEVDFFNNATFSALNEKILASPRGIHYPTVPHDDAECWERLNAVVPWYVKTFATVGSALPEGGQEMANTPYPVMVARADLDDDVAYNVVKTMVEHFDDYKDSAPGADSWAIENQQWHKLVPYHPGAIAYFKEIGAWPAEQDAIQEAALERQNVLMTAWAEYVDGAPEDDDAFNKGWMKARAEALEAAGMEVIFYEW